MPKVLYGVSPIGLGHATRAMAVVELLRGSGVEVRIFSGGSAADFLKSEGYAADDIVADPVPEVVDGEMKRALLWYLRSWLALKRTMPQTKKIFDEFKPDLVVCDEEFSGVSVANRNSCRKVFISDELELGFAHTWLAERVERRVENWYRGLQASVDLLIVPDFGEDSGNKRFVEPIVRKPTLSKEEVLAYLGFPLGQKFVLLSMSGSGIGDFLIRPVLDAMPDVAPLARLVITGNRGPRVVGGSVLDLGVVGNNQNLVAAADLVISTAGKSTIDEAAAAGTPVIVIPISHHAEQERNAAALGYSAESARSLALLISQKIGKRESPRTFGGAQRTSRLIMSLLSL